MQHTSSTKSIQIEHHFKGLGGHLFSILFYFMQVTVNSLFQDNLGIN